MSQENNSQIKWTLTKELAALRLKKLEQQRQLFEKRQRQKRQEPHRVQANPDAPWRHRRLHLERPASDRGASPHLLAGPALRKREPEVRLDSRFYEPMDTTMNSGRGDRSNCWALVWPTQAADSAYDQSELQDVEDEYQQFMWGSACGMDDDRGQHGDMTFYQNIDLEEKKEESHYVEMNSPAVDTEAVPRALGGEGSCDVERTASSPSLASDTTAVLRALEDEGSCDVERMASCPSLASDTTAVLRALEDEGSCDVERMASCPSLASDTTAVLRALEDEGSCDVERTASCPSLASDTTAVLGALEGEGSCDVERTASSPSLASDTTAVLRALEGNSSCSVGVAASSPSLKVYVLQPALEGHMVQCSIHRNQRSLEKGLFPVYYLYLEAADGWKYLLLAGRKRKWSKTSNYLISLDPMHLSRAGDNFVGKVRSNILGTKFIIFDDGVNPKDKTSHLERTQIRQELGAVCYEPNVWGIPGPRRMTVIIPEIDGHNQRIRVQPETEEESLLSRFQSGVRQGLVLLQNKTPVWSAKSEAFTLNFHGRVTRPSVKNFQIINPDKPDEVVLQFGRVAPDIFTMDFCFPLCPLQAFAICLSSFDGKLACS